MFVNGCDCSIVIKTEHQEMNIPYSDETIREAVTLLKEEAAIEGDGVCRCTRKKAGVVGCMVTPLTIDTTPLLLSCAFGYSGNPAYVSETRSLYRSELSLVPFEDSFHFDLIQDRGSNNEQIATSNEKKLYEDCRVESFELRIMREDAIKLKLDITGERQPAVYPYFDTPKRIESCERFNGDNVTYTINGNDYSSIYGLVLSVKKNGGTKSQLWIKRSLKHGQMLPETITEMTITAKLQSNKYEHRYNGMFQLSITNLSLMSDEIKVNSPDTVIGPQRYYVSGSVSATVFASTYKAIT